MKRLRLIFLITAILSVAGASGCGGSPDRASGLAGTWERKIMSEDGSFEGYLTFGTASTFEFTFKGEVRGYEMSEGTYRLSGRDITFEDGSCGGAGRYRFLVKPGALSFIPLGDGCTRRKAVLTGEWKRRDTPPPTVN